MMTQTFFRHDFAEGEINDKQMSTGRIYIAEADKTLQLDLGSGLEKRGFDVRVFDSGYPIVSMMDNWPDLFLIDIELPGINGMEVCKWLKSHETSCNIPVIFLSGDPYLKTLAASAMADDYIETFIDRDKLMEKIIDAVPLHTKVADDRNRS
jgi:DNA-binding response OmpR family regulator